MIRLVTVVLIMIACSISLVAQEKGYDIKVKINHLRDSSIYLAYHYGDKQYIKDTAQLDATGVTRFKGDEKLPGGIYLIVLPSKTYFEIVVGDDQHFSLTNDTTNYTVNFKSEGSLENKLFYEDIRYLSQKGQERASLKGQYDGAVTEDAKTELRAKMQALDDSVKAKRRSIVQNNPNLLYSKVLLLLQEIDVPEPPKKANGELLDSAFAYKYMMRHYFDNVDFADDRLLRTPILLQKVEVYLEKSVSPDPDSIIKVVDTILQRAMPNQETFKFWAITLLNKYANSKVMGHDAIYVHIVDNYYSKGKAYWVESADSLRIAENANSTRPLLIGKKAPRLALKDTSGKLHDIYKIPSKYLVLYFYSDDCGHCKKETPKLVAAYDSLKTQFDLKVVAVDTEIERENWLKFIEEQGMKDFINLADIELQNYFRETYHIKSTPQFYLLDKDRKIIGKRLSAEQLPTLLQALERMEMDKNGKDRVLDDNVTMPNTHVTQSSLTNQGSSELPPLLTIESIGFNKSTLEGYDSGLITLTIKNNGPGIAKNVQIKLSSANSQLNLKNKTIASIAANGGTETVSITVSAKAGLQTGETTINVEVFEPNFKVRVTGNPIIFNGLAFRNPQLIVAKFAVVEYQSANPNNEVDVNDIVEVKVAVQNTGQGPAKNVSVDVTNNQSGVMYLGLVNGTALSTQAKASFNQLPPGKFETLTYRYLVNSDFTASSLQFTIKVSEKMGQYGLTETKSVPINTQLKAEGYILEVALDDHKNDWGNVTMDEVPDFVSDVDQNIPLSNLVSTNTYALIIGNENYSNEIKVDYALSDARTFKLYMEKTLGIPAENIHKLENATYGEMLDGIDWITNVAKALKGQAKLIFYYAGHGMPDQTTKEAYLLPVDGSSSRTSAALALNETYNKLAAFPTQNVTIFLDACFSGTSREGMLTSGRGVAIKPKNAILSGNMVVFSAVSGEQTAHPYTIKQHGLFTYYLLKKLQETEGNISLGTLGAYISNEVSRQSILVNRKEQNPQVNVSPEIESIWKNWTIR